MSTELLERALDAGKIERSGNWFSFGGERLGNGKAAAAAFLVANPDVAAKIEVALQPPAPGGSNDTAGDAGASQTAGPVETTRGGSPKSDPKAAAAALRKAAKEKAEVRLFFVTSAVLHDADALQPGDPAVLNQAQFDALKSAGVVEGKWDDGAPLDD